MPRVRCEKCGRVAKTLYVRVSEKVKHEFDENDYRWKSRWKAVGYLCERCRTAKINRNFYAEEDKDGGR